MRTRDSISGKSTSGGERRRAILELLESHGSVTIGALRARFKVSEMTIRRDLVALQDAGRVQRTHGGAVIVRAPWIEPSYAAKQHVNADLKSRIARYAAEHLVDDGDVILLEGGTTVTAMAHSLVGKKGLTVATNGLYTTNELRGLPNATVICSGGILRELSSTFVGPTAEEFFHGVHARSVFVSATGLTIEHGYTDPNVLEAEVRKAMVASADRVVALVDSSKFGVVSLTTVAAVTEVDILVTDAGGELVDQVREAGVDVRIVP